MSQQQPHLHFTMISGERSYDRMEPSGRDSHSRQIARERQQSRSLFLSHRGYLSGRYLLCRSLAEGEQSGVLRHLCGCHSPKGGVVD